MKLRNIRVLTNILLLSQLRARGEKTRQRWWRRSKGLFVLDMAVFVGTFAFVFSILNIVPNEDLISIETMGIQILASIPIITLSFMVIYGIMFVVGEAAQYSSSEMINFMPITATEYVLASALSTVAMYLFLLTGILGISLAFAIHFGLIGVWAIAAVLSTFFMVVGGFVGEIIRALVNRVSSSFSKRGGRSAIIMRLVLIVFVIAISQIFFNPNILFMVLQSFAPQIHVLWFIPVMWPSIVVLDLLSGNLLTAVTFTALTFLFGFALMGCGVFLRNKYWVPLPVTIKLGGSKGGAYRGTGFFGKIGYSQAESAIVAKDARSLFRRKEMVRFLALPIIMLVPLMLTPGSLAIEEARYSTAAMLSLIGSGMFGLLLSMVSIGQEGPALWNIFAAPINAKSLFKAKLTVPLLISLVPAILFPIGISLFLNFRGTIAMPLFTISILMTIVAVLIGSYLGPKYMDLEERPRNNYVRGMGMFYAFIMAGAVGLICISPLILYAFAKPLALSIGINLIIALSATVAISAIFIALLYKLAHNSVSKLFVENPLE